MKEFSWKSFIYKKRVFYFLFSNTFMKNASIVMLTISIFNDVVFALWVPFLRDPNSKC